MCWKEDLRKCEAEVLVNELSLEHVGVLQFGRCVYGGKYIVF